MNKVQLIGTIQQIHFDDYDSKLIAEFILVYKEKINVIHYFKCTTKGECADLLYRMWFKGIEVAVEGKLLNKQNHLSVCKVLELEIWITDLLFLSVSK